MFAIHPLLFALAVLGPASSDDPTLLRVTFDDPSVIAAGGALRAVAAVEVRDGVARLDKDGRLATSASYDGDLAIDAELRLCDGAGIQLSMAGGDLRCTVHREGAALTVSLRAFEHQALGSAPASEHIHLRVRNRAEGVEVAIDGVAVLDHVAPQVFNGGPIEFAAASGGAEVDLFSVRRLGWADGIDVQGLDDARLERLRGLDRASFRLLEEPSSIDPVYRVWVDEDGDGAADGEPIEVSHRGLRAERDIPFLDQALALADVRPYLQWRVYNGEGKESGEVERGDDGSYTIAQAPGCVEVFALTGMPEKWPGVSAVDATNDRVLDRCCPTGPLRRNVFTEIPDDCDELRIELIIPGRDIVAHRLVLKRG